MSRQSIVEVDALEVDELRRFWMKHHMTLPQQETPKQFTRSQLEEAWNACGLYPHSFKAFADYLGLKDE